MNCNVCGKEIPMARLKILPHTKTCVTCSSANKVAGFPIISGKTTYSELQIVPQEKAEELYQKQDRKGNISEGVKSKNSTPPKSSNFE